MSRKRQKKTSNFDVGGSPTTKLQLNKHTTTFNHHNLLHSDKSTYTTNGSNNATRSNAYFYNNKHICKLSKGFLVSTVPLGLVALALLIVVSMTCIVGGAEEASAATTIPDPNFSIKLSLSGTVQEQEQLDAGVVGYISNNFTVSSTATDSYSIYLQPAEGYTNKLMGEKYTKEISGVGNNITVGNFPNNTWGYGISDTNNTTVANSALTYSTIPNGSTPIKTVSKPDDGDDAYKLVFAAKISDDMPVDHYRSQALLSVVGSPKNIVLRNLSDITYMQEVTPEICSRTPEADASGNNQYQLTDKRDNKKYWVAKLKDGNCWMTQNLDLDLNGRTLTTTDSDVATNWTSTTGASTTWSDTGNNIIKYYDPGNNYCTGSNCNATSSSNGGHDHQGNFYSFNAATAGTGASVTTGGQNAPSSICPKGWQLPTSNNTNDKSFGKLTADYGIANNAAGSTALRAAPLYFIYGGYVYSGSLRNAGSEGDYWSSTAYSASQAYNLGFSSSAVLPSGNVYRYYGRSIRCVAK